MSNFFPRLECCGKHIQSYFVSFRIFLALAVRGQSMMIFLIVCLASLKVQQGDWSENNLFQCFF